MVIKSHFTEVSVLCLEHKISKTVNERSGRQGRTSSGTGASISVCFIFLSIFRCMGNFLANAKESRNRRVSKNIVTDAPMVLTFVS